MKAVNTKLLSILFVCALSNTLLGAEDSNHQCTIDWQMRKEMFLLGSFHVKDKNGADKGAFLINYLPGASNVVHDSEQHWIRAKEALEPFLEGEKFWKNEIWGSFTHGLVWGWDTNASSGIGAIPKDFKSLWADFNSVQIGEFGAVGHKAYDCLGAVASLICRPILGAAALTAGALHSILVPPLKIAGHVIWSASEAGIGGVGWPVLKMVWNGSTWAATQVYTITPPEKDSLIVTWVPAKPDSQSCATN